jgi:hypothetical protein
MMILKVALPEGTIVLKMDQERLYSEEEEKWKVKAMKKGQE